MQIVLFTMEYKDGERVYTLYDIAKRGFHLIAIDQDAVAFNTLNGHLLYFKNSDDKMWIPRLTDVGTFASLAHLLAGLLGMCSKCITTPETLKRGVQGYEFKPLSHKRIKTNAEEAPTHNA